MTRLELVRFGLPQMLALSLVLHGGLATGYLLTHHHSAPVTLAAKPEAKAPTVYLLTSEETPDLPQPAPFKPVAVKPVETSSPVAFASPTQPVAEKKISAATPPPSLALEANPNAHLRALPPEAVLSPNPAPQLDGKNGVVFVLDVSGSMYEACSGSTRLIFARQELSRRIQALPDGIPFSITLYAQNARTSGPLVAANDATREAAVRFIMRDVDCGGGTNLPAGLTAAAQLAAGHLVLVSDGDLNITPNDLMPKARDILGAKGHCPALTVVAISPRPNSDARLLLQGLAEQQGGTYLAEQPDGNAPLLTSNKPDLEKTATP